MLVPVYTSICQKCNIYSPNQQRLYIRNTPKPYLYPALSMKRYSPRHISTKNVRTDMCRWPQLYVTRVALYTA